jgi:hypothetical protein
MLLKAKKIAFLGLLLACAVLLIVFGGIFDFSTFFLLAAASFCVGIAIRETGLWLGAGFYIACTILSLMLAPNKFYCFTFAAMGLYLVITEFSYERLSVIRQDINRVRLFWIIKYLTFNIIYIPILFLSPKLIYQGKLSMNSGIFGILIFGGQVVLYIYDKAYNYFQRSVWGKLRGFLVEK